MERNIDKQTVQGFGDEWTRFDQSSLDDKERQDLFDRYFGLFPWDALPRDAIGFDMGCGSGRWAKLVAPRVGQLYCIDPSNAVHVARENLKIYPNCTVYAGDTENNPIEEGSMDFGYSLGVLHHIPNTQKALEDCVKKIKPNAPFLLYLYYAFDGRPWWFKGLWKASDLLRKCISKMPYALRYVTTQIMACVFYYPLARMSWVMERFGVNVHHFPLSAYRSCSFYTMRTDALDRFGTSLERRFTKEDIYTMMTKAGLDRIRFSEKEPFWCAVGYRRNN